MVPPTPAPSTLLLRAAAAEREELERHRRELLTAREDLRAELVRIEASLGEVAERDALLVRLTGAPSTEPGAPAPPDARADRRPAAGRDGTAPHEGAPSAGRMAQNERATGGADAALRGPAIREAAVSALLAHPDRPQALHYRDWYAALSAQGHVVAGKDPLAVFLTQLGRSPVVRKGTQAGVYELDPGAPRRLRAALDLLHEELRALAGPGATGDIAATRRRRAALTSDLAQTERALEEAERVLGG